MYSTLGGSISTVLSRLGDETCAVVCALTSYDIIMNITILKDNIWPTRKVIHSTMNFFSYFHDDTNSIKLFDRSCNIFSPMIRPRHAPHGHTRFNFDS